MTPKSFLKFGLISFFILLFLPKGSLAFSSAETVVKSEVSGENASVHTEITNVVNEKEIKVESDQAGEIKVEVKDGEVNVETDPEASPTVVVSDLSEEEDQKEEETEKEVISRFEQIQLKISSYLEGFFSRLRRTFSFWK